MIFAGIAIVFVALLVAVWIGARRQQSALSAQIDRLQSRSYSANSGTIRDPAA